MSPSLEIQLAMAVAACACAVLGGFLVLRGMVMLTDAISHAILPGIVAAFFLTHDLSSPLMIVGAASAGVLTVWLVELVYTSGNLRQDAAIGIVFPTLFAIGVVLVSRYASNIHLDIDAVIMGEPAFIPFDRVAWGGVDIGPRALVYMSVVLLLNIALVSVLYKELKIATFDPASAFVMGLAPSLVHYILMSAVSITAVTAFDAVGTILVVALFSGPPMTAYLLTNRLSWMLVLSGLIGIGSAILGYWLARWFDVSIAGMVAVVIGLVFALGALFSYRGAFGWRLRQQRARYTDSRIQTLLVHLLHHEQATDETAPSVELSAPTLFEHLTWDPVQTRAIVAAATDLQLVEAEGSLLGLTDQGRAAAHQILTE